AKIGQASCPLRRAQTGTGRMLCHGDRFCVLFFFFFSSRRRHTRSYGDWSSDVCSSDLPARVLEIEPIVAANSAAWRGRRKIGKRSEERRVGKECRSGWSPDQ